MAGTTAYRELTSARAGDVAFASAVQEDNADIRRLLRENPMAGRIAITMEREPDFFAEADGLGTEKQTIVARAGGRVICVGSCTIRERFVNGQPRRVGYLGGLRLDQSVAGRFDILRRGYQFFQELQADRPADFYFTSIAADNVPARTFLERGLPGLPAYEFIGDYVTVLIPVAGRVPRRTAPADEVLDFSDILDCLNEHGREHQLAACWSDQELLMLQALNLKAADFCIVRAGGRIKAGGALWDQRAFKQTKIHSYAPWLARARPAINLASRLIGTTRLPAAGSTLAHAFLSPFMLAPNEPDALAELVVKAGARASERGIEFLTLGLAANDPRLTMLRRRFRRREYRSRIYVVRWPELGGAARELDQRYLGPEAAGL